MRGIEYVLRERCGMDWEAVDIVVAFSSSILFLRPPEARNLFKTQAPPVLQTQSRILMTKWNMKREKNSDLPDPRPRLPAPVSEPLPPTPLPPSLPPLPLLHLAILSPTR